MGFSQGKIKQCVKMRFRIRRVQEAGVRKAGFDGINNFSTVWDPDTDIAKNNNIVEMVKRRAAR